MLGFQRLRVAWPISKEEWWHYYWSICDVLACFISEYVGLFMSMWANHPGRDSCSGKCLWSWSPTKSRSSWPWKEGINDAYGFSYGSSAKLDKWEWYPPIKHGNGSPWMIGKTCIGDFPSQPRLTTGGYYMVWVFFFLAQPGGDPIADFSTHSQARIIQKKHGPNHCHVLSPFCWSNPNWPTICYSSSSIPFGWLDIWYKIHGKMARSWHKNM